ncbi:type VI secretion system tip protein VgrG [Pseudovibrio sp. Ad14]|nr:type VI secretion system tip protein VgrG [Pseudovibrio sp. Ad14]KZL10365.1 Phage-related baseplate assembly protein [Pseudovibrio sp. Ad14]
MNAIVHLPELFQEQDLAFTFHAPALPDSELLVSHFAASEQINELSNIDVTLASQDAHIDLHALLDTPATVTVHHKYLGLRHFAGVISQIARGDSGHHRTSYQLTLQPAVHRLSHSTDCRIFQKKSVPDIVKILLKEHRIEDVIWHLTETHEVREYCCQYRESVLTFLQRITAEEGIWFYFTSGKNGQHTLHFIDNPMIVPELEHGNPLSYNATSGGVVRGAFCSRFALTERLRSTSTMQRDYSFKNPPYNHQHRQERAEDNGSADDYELFEYPGRYKADGVGKAFTRHRLEAARVDATTGQGSTNSIHMMPGHLLVLSAHPNKDYNIKYHLLGVSHQGRQPQALSEEAGSGTTTYNASFEAMPARLPYRPKLIRKPLVDGPQIAHITGPEGEEIYCDEHGRVKVWFPWDRHSKKNDTSSCWIRVASNWAGASWGHIAIPRIGHEVVVDFLEGDPDQPIITGRTYHNNNKSPYQLPDHKTRMTIQSDSHKAEGFNELRFEDEGGQEEVRLHAQKDMNTMVRNDMASVVLNNRSSFTAKNTLDEVLGNAHVAVSGSVNVKVGSSSLAGLASKQIGGSVNKVSQVGKSMENYLFNGAQSGNYSIEADKSIVVNSGANYFQHTGKNFSKSVAHNNSESILGNSTVTVDKSISSTAKEFYTIVAGKRHTIICGGSKVIMNADGSIQMTGTNISINASSELILRGGKVKIN